MTKFSVFLFLLSFAISSINVVEPRRISSPRWSLPKISKPTARQPSVHGVHTTTNVGHTSAKKTSSDALIHSERVHNSENKHTPVQHPDAGSFRPGTIRNTLQQTAPPRNAPAPAMPAPIGFEKFVTHKPVSTQNSPVPIGFEKLATQKPVGTQHSPAPPNSRPYAPYPIVPHHNTSHSDGFYPKPQYFTTSRTFNYIVTPPPPPSPIGFDRVGQTPIRQPSYTSFYPSPPLHPHFPQGNPYNTAGQFNMNHNTGGNAANPNIFTPMHSFPSPNMAGAPYQSQHFIAQPAVQPIIPGQTVMMIPDQRDSGRGIGQLLKEALVFSTVNAGVNAAVNRIINPPHHHVYNSGPIGTTDTTNGASPSVTHITYNQYFNNQPIDNNTATTQNEPQVSPLPQPLTPVDVSIPKNPTTNRNAQRNQVNSAVTESPNVSPIGPSSTLTTASASGTVQSNGNNSEQTNGNNVPQYAITDEELYKISEKIFALEEHDVFKYLKMNLQNRSTPNNITDVAPNPLFEVDPKTYDIPSIRMIRNLYDNYEYSSSIKERKTIEKEKEENIFLDVLMSTNAINTAMAWLSDHNFIYPDDFETKDTLRHIWFNQFNGVTSGFERVFVSELYGDKYILGVQDWIYFNYVESQNRLNYMGYVDKLDLGNRASLVKVNFQLDGVLNENKTIFVGTTPELEISLYTICFYTRPNNLCPVSIGGIKFNIFTHAFRYFGKDLIDVAMPIF